MASLAESLAGLLMRMNSDSAVLTKIVPRRPNGVSIGGVVAVSADHWPAVEMLIDEYNAKHAEAFVKATADMRGNIEYVEEDDERSRKENGVGG